MIYAMHGIASTVTNDFIFRNIEPKEKFINYLEKTQPNITITFDDSTVAALNGAMLAKEYLFDVSLFINPSNIIDKRPHVMAKLNFFLDQWPKGHIVKLDGIEYKSDDKIIFRKRIKLLLLRMNNSLQRHEMIDKLLTHLDVQKEFPQHLLPPTVDQLKKAVSKGVKLGNHGWNHLDISTLSDKELYDSIEDSFTWLENFQSQTERSFCVPYGESTVSNQVIRDCQLSMVYLLDNNEKSGYLTNKVYNRTTLYL